MGMYEILRDGVKVVRNAGNVELSLKLAEVADELLEKNRKISELEKENQELKEIKKFKFADGKNYLVDPGDPARRLCPLCTKKHCTPVPLNGVFCKQCGGHYTR